MLAAILKEEPDWDALPAETPARIRALLERMLRKDPKQRLRDIGDARIRIEECIAGGPPEPEPAHAAARRGPSKLPWGLAAAFAATALVAVWLGLRPGPAPQVLHASLVLPADAPLSLAHSNPFSAPSVEISPAGDLIVYVARQEQGNRLMIRRLESFDAVALPDTAFAQHPRFSPDGRWVAFHAGGKIRKVAVSGGAPVDLCDGGFAPGLSWGDAGVLVFPREYAGGLWTVPADGGDATPLSHLDTERGEVSHRWPHVLPGSKHVLYTVKTAEITSFHEASIAAVSLESGETHTVLENAAYPWYVDTGHLLYGRDGSLFAVPFDPMRVAITGTPVQVLGDMITSPPNGAAHFSVSRSGTLVYVPGSPFSANARLAWVDRDGSMTPLSTPPDNYQGLRFSPDGSRVAMQISSANDRIWILDLERETLTPLTSVSGNDTRPIWSPDGTRVAYGNDASGTYDLFEKAADGSGAREPLLTGGTVDWPEDWSPDGTEIAVARRDGGGDMDIWILPMDGDRDPFAFLDSPAEEAFPAFAPNGRWMAYASSDSGRDEVYVSPYPGTGGRVRISDNGGTLPRWSRDGSELYYGTDTHMMAVPVRWEPSFRPGRPRELFALERPSVSFESYDVGPDGRFLLTYVDPASGIRSEIRLITNWVDTLDRRE